MRIQSSLGTATLVAVRSMIIRLILMLAIGLVGLGLGMVFFQRRLLYFPTRQSLGQAESEAAQMGLVPWKDAGGKFLGWRSPHPTKAALGTLLVMHGNAGTALDRAYYRTAFQGPAHPVPLDILLLEYPGYGPREGSPTERGLVEAAVHAIDQARRESTRPLYLVGESLGSAMAAQAAAARPQAVSGLALLVPLKNTASVARRHYPWLPSWLIRDTLRTDLALARLRQPVAFVVAGADEVVFSDLGQDLFHAYQGRKRLWILPDTGHNTLDFSPATPCWSELTTFLAQTAPES